MAYVVMIADGSATEILQSTWNERSARLRTHGKNSEIVGITRAGDALVLYDTNLAREFVRDVKKRIDGGKLVVFCSDEPHEIVDASAEIPLGCSKGDSS